MERKFKQGPILPAMLEDLENKNKELLKGLSHIIERITTVRPEDAFCQALKHSALEAIKKATE